MRSIVILGAGEIGGSLVRHLAAADIASEVILVDDAGHVAAGKALDILQAGPVDRFSTHITGTTDASVVVGADAIVLADRYADPNGEFEGDAGVQVLRRAVHLNGRALLLCAGSRQLSVIEQGVREAGIPSQRLIGSAPEALRSAIMSMTALEAECSPCDISLTVVGRPPGQIIVPWNEASIAGLRATEVLTPPAITRLDARSTRLWPPGPMALAAAATRFIVAAVTQTHETLSAFVADTRVEGARRAGMLPVTLTAAGVSRILAPSLSARDRVRLDTALHR